MKMKTKRKKTISRKKAKKAALKSPLKLWPTSRKGILLSIAAIAIVSAAVGISGVFTKLSGAYTPPLKEGAYGCNYDFFEGMTNNWRASHGLVKLTPYGSLESHACTLVKNMIARNKLYHDMKSWCSYACGQNVGWNSASGHALWNGWLASPEHLTNIKHAAYRNQGCAYRWSGGRIWGVCNYQNY